jgi:hypothetical protein
MKVYINKNNLKILEEYSNEGRTITIPVSSYPLKINDIELELSSVRKIDKKTNKYYYKFECGCEYNTNEVMICCPKHNCYDEEEEIINE